MATRLVDPRRFLLLGSFTNWEQVARDRADDKPEDPYKIASRRGLDRPSVISLRWLLHPEMGLPSTPFTVWRRPSAGVAGNAIPFSIISLLTVKVVKLATPCLSVEIDVNGGGGLLIPFAAMPWTSSMHTPGVAAAGFATVSLSGPRIQTIVIPTGMSVLDVRGVTEDAVKDPAWEPVEIVGLPDDGTLSGVNRLDEPQGLIGMLGDATTAAHLRFLRGAPFYGWDAQVAPGATAPLWTLADPVTMIKVFQATMLKPISDMVTSTSVETNHLFTVQHTLGTPTGQTADTEFSPLRTVLYGASTDPLSSLVTGYGTAYEVGMDNIPGTAAPVKLGFDYMVTADYDKGALRSGTPDTWAALLINPRGVLPPPAPTGLAVSNEGLQAPVATDQPWRTVNRVSWGRVDDLLPFQIGSYAFGRQQLVPALAPVEPLMLPRVNDTALQPIAATLGADPSLKRMAGLDDSYEIMPTPNPNPLMYAVAMQDLFGIWSRWATVAAAVGEPPVRPAPILSARLDTTAAASVCPATLVFEVSWDWANRSPQRVEIFGRRYVQAKSADRPADLSTPGTLTTSLTSGAGEVATIHFGAGGSASATGGAGLSASLQYVSLDGQNTTMTPPTNAGPRRYRVVVTGFGLDFSAAGLYGVALWARGIEALAPSRVGGWSTEPIVASAADPRPPVITVENEDVLLASLGDAAGEHHALLTWPAVSGAAGYFVYTVAESAFRAFHAQSDAPPSMTLSQRLAALRTLFASSPDRRPFTRVNAAPVTTASMAVTLPRGSKEIHLYVVLGISAGQVESAWPTLSDPLRGKRPIAYAAPQVVCPSPPTLEIARVLDSSVVPPRYRAAVRVQTQAGATVGRVDLHRVRVPDAAVDLFSMGPPVASLSGSSGAYTVIPSTSTERGEVQTIGLIRGVDGVEGSWKPVFYRAVAWGTHSPARGQFGGRSEPSALRSVVVPPADPPDLSPLTYVLPVITSPDARIDLSTAAPVAPTTLGPHRIDVEVIAERADGTTYPVLRHPESSTPPDPDANRLDLLGSAGPVAGESTVWRGPTVGGVTPVHVMARRDSFGDGLRARIRITDPLGRITERTLDIPASNPVPPPDLNDPEVQPLGSGEVLTLWTSVPDQVSGAPYRLRVRYVLAPVPPARRGRTLQVEVDLAAIATFRRGEDIFTAPGGGPLDPDEIPLRRSVRRSGRTDLAVGLIGPGTLAVTLTGPDGAMVVHSRRHPSGLRPPFDSIIGRPR